VVELRNIKKKSFAIGKKIVGLMTDVKKRIL
jgi:hypothetical protein